MTTPAKPAPKPAPKSTAKLAAKKPLVRRLPLYLAAIALNVPLLLILALGVYSFVNPNTVDTAGSIEKTAARGETLAMKLDGGFSISSLRAAPDGITLALADPDGSYSTSVDVAPPSEPSWGDTVTFSGHGENNIDIVLTFTVPSDIPSQVRTLTGSMRGTLIYPIGTQGTGDSFENQTKDVAAALTLHLASAPSFFNGLDDALLTWPGWTFFCVIGPVILMTLGSGAVLSAAEK